MQTSKEPMYTAAEEALIDLATAEVSQLHDILEGKKGTVPESELTVEKKALLQGVKKLNSLLNRTPLEYVPNKVSSI